MTAAVVLDTLMEASVRAAGIAALVALALVVFRIKAASVRHAVWTSVLGAMILLPALSAWLPAIPVPEWMPGGAATGWVSERTTAANTDAKTEAVGPLANTSGLPALSAEPAALSAKAESAAAAQGSTTAATSSLSVRGWIVAMWLVGASILLLREGAGWWMARRLARHGARMEDEVYQTNRVTTPVVVGVLAPRVLVPESWPRWGADTRRMVVLHERAHITRHDPLVAAAARVNRSVFWFHPLAWWLERHLSRVAERACDEAVVRQVSDPRHYAGLLIEMARRLRRQGRRVAWQGIGIVSGRHLEDRINSVLEGPTRQPSWLVRLSVGVVCALLIGIGAACERKAQALAQDPEVTASMAAEAKRMDAYQTAIAMTSNQAAALAQKVAVSPEDMEATRDLLNFYQASGQKVLGWDAMVAARRPYLLRLIERHPESYLANWPLSRPLDPVGYDMASALWAAHVKPAEIPEKLLVAAVRFYEVSEPFVAERLLLRAHEMNPTGPSPSLPFAAGPGASARRSWLDNLGNLYGKAVLAENPVDDRFVRHAARQLDETTEWEVLLGAGNHLVMTAGWQAKGATQRSRGMAYLERAAALDLGGDRTQRALQGARRMVSHEKEWAQAQELFGVPANRADAAAFDKLTDALRLEHAHELLWGPYGAAMAAYAKPNRAAAEEQLAEFQRRADIMAELATSPSLASDAAARLTADVHIAMGTLALRQGKRNEAVKRLEQAAAIGAEVPPGRVLFVDDSSIASGQATRFSWELLDVGERESVAAFYDVVAKTLDGSASNMFGRAAEAIRAGRMPREYQMFVAQQYNAKNANALKITK